MKEIKKEMYEIEKLLDKALKKEYGEMPEDNFKKFIYLYLINNQDFINEIDTKALFESIKREYKLNQILKE